MRATGRSIAIDSSSSSRRLADRPRPRPWEAHLPRDLKARGYQVIGVDGSPTLIDHARAADPDGTYLVADGASLLLADRSMRLVTAFMSLHDFDDTEGAVVGRRECCSRVDTCASPSCIPTTPAAGSSLGRLMPRPSCASRTSRSAVR